MHIFVFRFLFLFYIDVETVLFLLNDTNSHVFCVVTRRYFCFVP